ncbi:MAG: biotin synthase BioB [Nitrospirae bacterium GWF2_44_13]|nr:MAG: biotin synthase BioB [Nitrospirae bacterium GWF2_44_13]OGW65137.1 MAG: biotin synthase BioB [Nitrospirae bacterium RIFOXYA2_FULL_44_9]OGW73783.1 MAG: biotin synthase BioB [Nitrospirae bacterium RIFOXYC2_FULL_44_7]HBG93134.1 biotin synthase BioB [Nitrospiraceae bacterium]
MIDILRDRVISGQTITKTEAVQISALQKTEMSGLFAAANKIRQAFRGDFVDLCAIVNAKSGACPEDCSYCAQSSKSRTETAVYPLLNKNAVIEKAKEARDAGVKRFCIVTSGRKTGKNELKEICSMIKDIREIGLLPCSTLGLLNKDELKFLKDSGLERYHHNLETSEGFFPEICRTHTYSDKLKTIDAAIAAGLSVCSGGIFGLGETWEDRIDMALKLKELPIDSVPINYLIPVKGTPLGEQDMLDPFEALKIVSLYRFILPQKEIRVCGGRMQVLGEFNSMVFMAGADSLLTGNYLTATGRTFSDDRLLIKACGLRTG